MELDLPDELPLVDAGEAEEDMDPDAALEGRVEVRGHIGGKDHHPLVLLQLLEQDVDRLVRLSLVAHLDVAEASGRDTVRLVKEQDGILGPGFPERGPDVLPRVPRPAALQ